MTATWQRSFNEGPTDTLRRLHALVDRITYKRGARLTVLADIGSVRFLLTYRVPHIDPPYSEIELTFAETTPIDWFMDKPDEYILREWIYPFILRSEEHEVREWFKFRGEHVFEPHPELLRRAR